MSLYIPWPDEVSGLKMSFRNLAMLAVMSTVLVKKVQVHL